MLWGLTAIGLIAPEAILTCQALWRIRSAKVRQRAAAAGARPA
jgi:hypothetical protein